MNVGIEGEAAGDLAEAAEEDAGAMLLERKILGIAGVADDGVRGQLA